jgi:hypothetical protein
LRVKKVLCGQRNKFPRPLISVFQTGAATFSFKQLLNCPREAEWTLFQIPYFSEYLAGPGLDPGTSGSVARNSNQYVTKAVGHWNNFSIILQEKLYISCRVPP